MAHYPKVRARLRLSRWSWLMFLSSALLNGLISYFTRHHPFGPIKAALVGLLCGFFVGALFVALHIPLWRYRIEVDRRT